MGDTSYHKHSNVCTDRVEVHKFMIMTTVWSEVLPKMVVS